jgi:hypothetical protein
MSTQGTSQGHTGRSRRQVRWAGRGSAALLGGALWCTAVVVHAGRPRGCVATECATRPMRDSGVSEGVLAIFSAVLIVTALVGLVRRARRTRSLDRAGEAGVRLGVAGLGLLVAAGLTQAVLFDGSFGAMPYLVLPGMAAVAAGFLLAGIALVRAREVPGWCGVLLVLGSVAALGANEQTAAVLLLLPVGVAWMAVGCAVLARGAAD